MKNIFLDTNVVIDFLTDRKPFSLYAAKLFNFSLSGKAMIYISGISYNNIYYIVRQSLSNDETIRLLRDLFEMTEMIDVTKNSISQSLKADWRDFENAIQYHCALSVTTMDCIVTRSTKDFKKSALPVMTPQEAVSLIESTH